EWLAGPAVQRESACLKVASRAKLPELEHSPRMIAQRHMIAAVFGPHAPQLAVAQRKSAPPVRNDTGLSDQLKSGIESLSAVSLDHVKVHYNSAQPAQMNAHAYAQGNDIHLASGQEQHLPHEAWHVVQQAQGRVRPTMQLKGAQIADTDSLEREADTMGARALAGAAAPARLRPIARRSAVPMQMRWGAYDGANREDARQILINRNRSNEVQTGLGGVLEEMLHFKDAALADIDDALRQMPADFTSAVRGKSITV